MSMHWVTFADGRCVGVEAEAGTDSGEIFDRAWEMINEEITCQTCGAKWTGEGRLNYWRQHQELGLCGLMNDLVASSRGRV